jgi:hypothetical protein
MQDCRRQRRALSKEAPRRWLEGAVTSERVLRILAVVSTARLSNQYVPSSMPEVPSCLAAATLILNMFDDVLHRRDETLSAVSGVHWMIRRMQHQDILHMNYGLHGRIAERRSRSTIC